MVPKTGTPLIVLGAGGHARVLLDALRLRHCEPLGVTDPDASLWGSAVLGVPVLGDDNRIQDFAPNEVMLVNALGSTMSTALRQAVWERWRGRGYQFTGVRHLTAVVAQSAELEADVQVLAGSLIGVDAYLGHNSIVNTGVIVEHDCRVGQHVHLAPGVTLSGNVTVGDGSHLGTGCTVIQDVDIGQGCVVGAGAVVVRNLEPFTLAVGVPARVIKTL